VRSASQPGAPEAAADPRLAATVRLLHRRHGWSVTAFWGFMAFLLSYGAYLNAVNETGSDTGSGPSIMRGVILAAAVLTVVALTVVAVDSRQLRRQPAELRAQAAAATAHHPVRAHAHRYPPRHRLSWVFAWLGMVLILFVTVVCVPGVVDGIGYLAGAGRSGTFVPQSYDQVCGYRTGCSTVTDGILENPGGASTATTWPAQVPLGQSFKVREPVWSWGAGGSLIDSDGTAVAAIIVSLLLDGFAVLILVWFVRLARNWLRHHRQRSAPTPA